MQQQMGQEERTHLPEGRIPTWPKWKVCLLHEKKAEPSPQVSGDWTATKTVKTKTNTYHRDICEIQSPSKEWGCYDWLWHSISWVHWYNVIGRTFKHGIFFLKIHNCDFIRMIMTSVWNWGTFFKICSILFEMVKTVKNKKIVRYCSNSKGTKAEWILRVSVVIRAGPATEHRHQW